MPTFRVRSDDDVLLEPQALSLHDATLRAIDAADQASRVDRHDCVLEERVGRSWRARVTIHPPARW